MYQNNLYQNVQDDVPECTRMGEAVDSAEEQLADLRRQAAELEAYLLPQKARLDDSPDSFAAFFKLVTGKTLLPHSRTQVETIYKARAEGKYIGIEAFRGSAKTTVFVTFFAYRIGKNPTTHNLLIQVGDDIAEDNAKRVADIIANNAGWKKVFPNIVPDIDKGWGAGGYEVKDTNLEYTDWRQLNAERKDPSFIGLGYKSREIIGKRPDGVVLVDDILDENNTASEREMLTVENILTGTIFPTMTDASWLIFDFTPWKENDPVVKKTAGSDFILTKTPVYTVADKDTPGAVEFHGEWVLLTWPERFDVPEIERRLRLSGTQEFARMYLLDLTKANNRVFKYQIFPNEHVDEKWAIVAGVDYAGTMDKVKNAKGENDFFAMAFAAKHPLGGVVVTGGVLGHFTQAQSENKAVAAQETIKNWQYAVVEGDGKGEEFIQVMQRHANFVLVPMKTGGKSKAARLERQMGPWLEFGRVRISDAENEYLNELRRELDQYPLCEHDDALDALYWALRGLPDVLTIPEEKETLPDVRREKPKNPFNSLGRH